MNNAEETLRFVSKIIDGELFIYDDGYIIEIKSPSLWMKETMEGKRPWSNNQGAADLESVSGVKLLFDLDGTFNTVQYT